MHETLNRPMTFRAFLLLVLLGCVLAVSRLEPPGPGPLLPSFAASPPQQQDNRPDGTLDLQVEESADGVRLSWTATGRETVLYRSTSPLGQTRLNDVRFPIVTIRPTGQEYVDHELPAGVTVRFQLRVRDERGKHHYSEVMAVDTPDVPLPRVEHPTLFVDKTRYVLEVRDGGRTVKRYPIALGRNPRKRKLHQDNASTPEGRYRILGLQPQATFYRAYDLDYPTPLDRERYDFAAAAGLLPSPTPGIGGEIQIHGKGIDSNWTYGCIAMRDEDMDELFSRPEIAAGVVVEIVGREITAADLKVTNTEIARLQEALRQQGYNPGPADGRLGAATRKALGQFQARNGLPITLSPDQRTLQKLAK